MRNKMVCLLGLVLAVIFLSGCAAFQTSTTQVLPTVANQKPTADKALIIVDGTAAWAGMFKLYAKDIYDGPDLVGKVGTNGRLVWLREPGQMVLSINKVVWTPATVVAGRRYHYKINVDGNLNYSIENLMVAEKLLAAPLTAERKLDLLDVVETSSSLKTLQCVIDKTPDPEIRNSAHSRLITVITTCTNMTELAAIRDKAAIDRFQNLVTQSNDLILLANLAKATPQTVQTIAAEERAIQLIKISNDLILLANLAKATPQTAHTIAAEERAIQLIASWSQNKDKSRVNDLLVAGYVSKAKDQPIARSALTAAEAIVKANWEVVSQDVYTQDFKAPDGSFLPELLAQLRATHYSKSGGMKTISRIQSDGTKSFTNTTTSSEDGVFMQIYYGDKLYLSTTRLSDGLVQHTCRMPSLYYQQYQYGVNQPAYEIIMRTGSNPGVTQTTEVFHYDGVIYRTSKQTSLDKATGDTSIQIK